MSDRLTDTELSDLEQLARVHGVATAGSVERLIDEVRELRREIDAMRDRHIQDQLIDAYREGRLP